MHECFHRGAATFMILGNLCTRGCGFCSVPKGSPAKQEFSLDSDEPRHVAEMAAQLKLRYVVITSVNRDDLPDGGSHHFAQTVREVRRALPAAKVEVLTPDFCGDLDAVARCWRPDRTYSTTTWKPCGVSIGASARRLIMSNRCAYCASAKNDRPSQ